MTPQLDAATAEIAARRDSLEAELAAARAGTRQLAPEEIAAIRVHLVEIDAVLPRR